MTTLLFWLGAILVLSALVVFVRHADDARIDVRLDPDWQDKDSLATIEREEAHGIIRTETIRRIATSDYQAKDKPSGVRSGYTRNR